MTVVIGGSSPEITFADSTVQNTAALPLTGGSLTGNITSTGSISSVNTFGFKNRIINGAMVISQRGTSFTGLNTAAFTTDRFNVYLGSLSTATATQSSVAPAGFINSLAITVTTGGTINALNYIYQPIEGYNVADLGFGTSAAQTVTLSFWVRSSITGTFGGSLRNYAPSSTYRSYPFTYSISSANTWTQISITITGDGTGGSGQWNTNNNGGMALFFDLGSSSNTGSAGSWSSNNYVGASGTQTSFVTTTGATFYLTGVQLEVGTQATSFDYRPYGTELQLCQRYFQTPVPFEAGYFAVGYAASSTASYYQLPFEVKMRTAPTMSYSGSVSNFFVNWSGSTFTGSALSFQGVNSQSALIGPFTSGSGLTTGQAVIFQGNGSSAIFASAEL